MNSLVWSGLAGLCTALGAFFLFLRKNWSNRDLAFFLGLAAGVMVAVVLFDMMPSALLFTGQVLALLGIALGILLMIRVGIYLFQPASATNNLLNLGYLIMLGIALHDLPEGMAIAFGDALKARTGMVIALGIGIHNIPEGMAIAAPLIMGGMSRGDILLRTLLIGLITPLGTILGHCLVFYLPALLPFMLGFASGIMIYLVVFQLMPQARQYDRTSRWQGFWLGMLIIFLATFM
ncbi:MAG TPA: ZIP family metal transporter [Syntrophomonadaceae bacterium]|nr:ZIP family metal transporter [Syntrophomonadaceae bacterium]